jgi:hypothetical protein
MKHVTLTLCSFFCFLFATTIHSQVSIPHIFQTSGNFGAFVKSIADETKIELSDESKKSIRFDSFIPTFVASGQFKSIKLAYSGGKQCFIQRVAENQFVIQTGRKKL